METTVTTLNELLDYFKLLEYENDKARNENPKCTDDYYAGKAAVLKEIRRTLVATINEL